MSVKTKANFLFWNIHRNEEKASHKDMVLILADLAVAHDLDAIFLAEAKTLDIESLENHLTERTETKFANIGVNCKKIVVLARKSIQLTPVADTGRMSCLHWHHADNAKVLIAVAHLPDKLHNNNEDIKEQTGEWIGLINEKEEEEKSYRTILVGDLNLNPFDTPLTDAPHFNAVSCRRIAAKNERQYKNKKYRYFYNPMWRFFR